MMAGINMDSIIAKAKEHMKTPKRQAEIRRKVDSAMIGSGGGGGGGGGGNHPPSAREAGAQFAKVLEQAINSSGIPASVADAITHIVVDIPVNLGGGKYLVKIKFAPFADGMRQSMSTKKSYPAVNLVDLYNDGVDHFMQQIFERDKNGALVAVSNIFIPGAHYMETAVANFMGSYASKYNVISLDINKGFDI